MLHAHRASATPCPPPAVPLALPALELRPSPTPSARIVALPFSQFLLQKGDGKSFEFVDSTGHYGDAGLKAQLSPQKMLKLRVVEVFPFVRTVAHRARRLAGRPKASR